MPIYNDTDRERETGSKENYILHSFTPTFIRSGLGYILSLCSHLSAQYWIFHMTIPERAQLSYFLAMMDVFINLGTFQPETSWNYLRNRKCWAGRGDERVKTWPSDWNKEKVKWVLLHSSSASLPINQSIKKKLQISHIFTKLARSSLKKIKCHFPP